MLAIFDPSNDPVGSLLWALMITNADRPAWSGDVPIPGSERMGLIIPSKVRTAKVATITAADAVRIGRLDAAVWDEVRSITLKALDAG